VNWWPSPSIGSSIVSGTEMYVLGQHSAREAIEVNESGRNQGDGATLFHSERYLDGHP